MRSVFFEPFRLDIHPHPHDPNEMLLRLFCHDQPQHVERLQLKILKLLADDHPGEELDIHQIAAVVWPAGAALSGVVQKQISLLRTKVLNDNAHEPKFIETFRDNHAYKFIAAVHAEGELERLTAWPKWLPARLTERLSEVQRNDQDTEDLRIVTSGLVPNWQDFDYGEHLRRGIRMRIVMMNPENEALMKARYNLRQDKYRFRQARSDFKNQIDFLTSLMSRFPVGALQVRLSNAMPLGPLLHTQKWALLGIFPAHGRYSLGPMLETPQTTSLWKTLYEDWKARWNDRTAQRLRRGNPSF